MCLTLHDITDLIAKSSNKKTEGLENRNTETETSTTTSSKNDTSSENDLKKSETSTELRLVSK